MEIVQNGTEDGGTWATIGFRWRNGRRFVEYVGMEDREKKKVAEEGCT